MLFAVTAHHQPSGHYFRPHRHCWLSLNTWRLSSMPCQQAEFTTGQLASFSHHSQPQRSISRLCPVCHVATYYRPSPHSTHPSHHKKRHAPKENKPKFPGARVRLKWLHDYWHLLLPGACTARTRSIQYTTSLSLPLYSISHPPSLAKPGSRLISQPFYLPSPTRYFSLVIRL